MGTTLVALFEAEDGVYLAHVGDSRIYRVRDGNIEQLTEDLQAFKARYLLQAPRHCDRLDRFARPRSSHHVRLGRSFAR